jgi:hypothetical protein
MRVIKSRRIRWSGEHVWVETNNAYKMFVARGIGGRMILQFIIE